MMIKAAVGRILYAFAGVTKSWMGCYLRQKHIKRFGAVGKGIRLNGISTISGHDTISIGDNVHIGSNAFIAGEGGLYIGDNVHISRNLVLYTRSHDYEGTCLPYDDSYKDNSVYIGKNVWIGMNVTILPGTHIEEGCIIGAGAVVAGRLEKLGIYGACPAQKIKERNGEHYFKLEEAKKYGGINGELYQDRG